MRVDTKNILLNKGSIDDYIQNTNLSHSYQIHIFDSIDSTNTYLKSLPLSQHIEICCAEHQTNGRGRFARNWYSPYTENIYCSIRWPIQGSIHSLSGLSLVSSLALLSMLKDLNFGPELGVKWPNDLIWREKKLSGSLIEVISVSKEQFYPIIGIGLNVNTDTLNKYLSDTHWCSLFEISGNYYDRNLLISKLLEKLNIYINRFTEYGMPDFIEEWNNSDLLAGRLITVHQSVDCISGVARGITLHGELILEDAYKEIHYLSSGDTSLNLVRPKQG